MRLVLVTLDGYRDLSINHIARLSALGVLIGAVAGWYFDAWYLIAVGYAVGAATAVITTRKQVEAADNEKAKGHHAEVR